MNCTNYAKSVVSGQSKFGHSTAAAAAQEMAPSLYISGVLAQ